MAQREIGLSVGEPPASKGYTPSVFAELPRLLERAGPGLRGSGSITGLFTVLVEGDDHNEPISDAVRGILDGHIVLTRDLAAANHFPAISVSASISRLMTDIVPEEQYRMAGRIRDILSTYEKSADLVSIGAYKQGTNPKLDFALTKMDAVNSFLKQGINEVFTYDETVALMQRILQ